MTTYLARLTWNQDQWRRPSGALGKREQGTYVARQGFGHEEWLNRREWHIDGWCQGFVQGVSKSRERLEGQRINLRFYSITPVGDRVYVGQVTNAEVLTEDQATAIVRAFVRKGWLETMKREVDAAGGRRRAFNTIASDPTSLANIRFRPANLRMFAAPIPAAPRHRVWTLNRYQLYQFRESDNRHWHDRTRRAALQKDRGEHALIRKAVRETVVRRIENQMQREVTEILRKRFGRAAVTREQDFADIRVRGAREVLIEVKAESVARRAIRDALGQLLFYAYRDGRPESEPELVVVGRGAPNDDDQQFLRTLKSRFSLVVTYKQYCLASHDFNL